MKRAALGLVAALLLGAGCTRRSTPVFPANTVHWQMTLSVAPSRPRQLDPAQFQVQVKDKNRKPVSGAAVTVQLAMPAMDMGRNDVKMHEMTPPGTYIGTGRFSMPGDWQAVVAADKGAAHQSQTFPLSVQ